MTGKEIRRYTWEQSKGNRIFFVGALFLTMIPSVLVFALILWKKANFFSWFLWPLNVFTYLVSFGLTYVALQVTESGKKDLRDLLTPFRSPWLKKALLLAVFLVVADKVLLLGPELLAQKGNWMIEASGYTGSWASYFGMTTDNLALYHDGTQLKSAGDLLSKALSFFKGIVLFPLPYLLFLEPGRKIKELIRRGTALGWRSFKKIFIFLFWLDIPVVGIFILWNLPLAIARQVGPNVGSLAAIFVSTVAAVVLLFCYLAYAALAQAKLARELYKPTYGGGICPPEEKKMVQLTKNLMGSPAGVYPPRRKLRLARRDGWYYCDMTKGPLKKGPLERK